MFHKIRDRLLLSYFVVFASLLGIFALAFRVVFTHIITQQSTEKLTALAEGAAVNAELEDVFF